MLSASAYVLQSWVEPEVLVLLQSWVEPGLLGLTHTCGVGFVRFVGSNDLQAKGLPILGDGQHRDKVHCVSAFEHVGWVALGEATNFVGCCGNPFSVCGAVTEFGVFHRFPCVWVDGSISYMEPSLVSGRRPDMGGVLERGPGEWICMGIAGPEGVVGRESVAEVDDCCCKSRNGHSWMG
jgi:hypothetical protein